MKGKNLFFIALLILAVGVVFMLTAVALTTVSIVIGSGILFILAGLITMLVFLRGRDEQGRSKHGIMASAMGWFASVAAIILGLIMVIRTAVFVPLVATMLSIIIFCTAVYQFCLLLFGSRPSKLPAVFFIAPVLLFGAAVYVYLRTPGPDDHAMMYATAGSFLFFGLVGIIESVFIGRFNHKSAKAAKASENVPEADQTTTATHDEAPESAD